MAALAVVAALVTGCKPSDTPVGTTTPRDSANVSVAAALDSCFIAFSPEKGAASREARRSKLSGSRRRFAGFSIFVPKSVRVETSDSTAVSFAWPGCERCLFRIGIAPDSGISLEARVAARVAEQARIDSVNHDPRTAAFEFDDMDGPPQSFETRAGRGYEVGESCGDCWSESLLFGHNGRIATIRVSQDDDPIPGGSRVCEMVAVGKTFEWLP